MQLRDIQLKEDQGTIATVAALAAGSALLLSRQLRDRQPSAPVRAMRAVQDQVLRRPARVGPLAALVIGGLVWSQMRRSRGFGGTSTSSVESSIEVDVPLHTAYNQWTQFEQFPQFMASVQEVRQIDDTHLHWCATVAGKTKEWDAEITEQIPDQRIAWRSTGGVDNSGVVTFQRISDSRTKVTLQMDYRPETMGEKIGDTLGGVRMTAKANLKRFKDLIEGRGVESGAWRGTVTQH